MVSHLLYKAPNALGHYLIDNQIVLSDVCPTLKVCIPTSETVTKEDREILIEGFGVKVVNEYGVSEVGGIVAFEDNDSNWRLSAETQFVEVLDKKNNPIENNKVKMHLSVGGFNPVLWEPTWLKNKFYAVYIQKKES